MLLVGKQSPAPAQSLAIVGGVFGILALAMVFLLANTRITITAAGVESKNPFRTKSVEWQRVTQTYIVHRRRGKAVITDWCFDEADGRKVRFSVKFYPVASLAILAKAVIEKSATAITDERIYTVSKGKIPWRPRLFS